MSRDSNKRRDKKEDDLTLLQQIREANVAAGEHFLEYLVLQRRSLVRKLLKDPLIRFLNLYACDPTTAGSRIAHAACRVIC
jgi:hypothetical protein